MRQRLLVLGVVVLAAGGTACAALLGIDDGIPRDDAGVDVTVDAPVTADAQPDVVLDAGDGGDATVDAPKPFSPLACGSATCNAVGEVCCRTGTGGDAGYTYKCLADAGACTGTAPLTVSCDRAANCAAQGKVGEICCANAYQTAATKVSCSAPSFCPTSTFTIVCGPGDDEICASVALTCQTSTVTAVGWTICK